jgi:3-vinyl bacteriochlorophyllide hydratase
VSDGFGVKASTDHQGSQSPWHFVVAQQERVMPKAHPTVPLYTPAERVRRDASGWTLVQGILAPLQFLIFFVSLTLVLRYLVWGTGLHAAACSVVLKVAALYLIMITGALWERDVFGRYLFAPAFFWEDTVSMLVIALHSAYLFALWFGLLDARPLMLLALAAYASYLVNASQFVLKLRRARLDPVLPCFGGMDPAR